MFRRDAVPLIKIGVMGCYFLILVQSYLFLFKSQDNSPVFGTFCFVLSPICRIYATELLACHSCNCLEAMGTYINRGNFEFRDIVTHEYVDKSR